MIIKINGKEEQVADVFSILELVKQKNLIAERIVVEHNLKIVPRENWAGVYLRENDSVEVVSFVGGG